MSEVRLAGVYAAAEKSEKSRTNFMFYRGLPLFCGFVLRRERKLHLGKESPPLQGDRGRE